MYKINLIYLSLFFIFLLIFFIFTFFSIFLFIFFYQYFMGSNKSHNLERRIKTPPPVVKRNLRVCLIKVFENYFFVLKNKENTFDSFFFCYFVKHNRYKKKILNSNNKKSFPIRPNSCILLSDAWHAEW